MDEIFFANEKFKIREINAPGFGNVLISTTTLNNILVKDGIYVSDEAIEIDEKIFYFVEPEEILLPEKELSSIVIQQVQ